MSEALQRELLLHLLCGHPQPWHIEQDWTTEIVDASGTVIVKLQTIAAGEELIRLAAEVAASLEKAMMDGNVFDCKGGCGQRTVNLTGTCTHCQAKRKAQMTENKIDHVKKLLAFLKLDKFNSPQPLPPELRAEFAGKMENADRLIDCDSVCVEIEVANPLKINIRTSYESGHNGDEFNRVCETVPVFDEFLDFAISVLRNRVYNAIDTQFRQEESDRQRKRIESRMKELGL